MKTIIPVLIIISNYLSLKICMRLTTNCSRMTRLFITYLLENENGNNANILQIFQNK